MQTPPYTFALSAVDWNVFCTLTFSGKPPTEVAALGSLDKWLYWVAHLLRLKRKNLLAFGRIELGERGGRVHLHCLLKVPAWAIGRFVVKPPYVPLAHKRWGRGLTRFRLLQGKDDPALPYVLKDTAGGDEYEKRKTALASNVVLSNGLQVLMRKSVKESAIGVSESAMCDTVGA